MSPPTGTLLIPGDLGASWGSRQAGAMTRNLEMRVNQRVVLCNPEDPRASVPAGIHALVNAGARRVVVVPLGLLPIPERGPIWNSLVCARRERPFLSFHAAEPLTWLEWSSWIRLTGLECINGLQLSPADTPMLLAGQRSSTPLTNADLPRLAHLVYESSPFARVTHAFGGTGNPGLSAAFRELALLGFSNVVVVPWLLADDKILQQLQDDIAYGAQAHKLHATLTLPSLAHPALINILVCNHFAALSDDRFQSSLDIAANLETSARSNTATQIPPSGITPLEALELQELERRINALLPPEYRGRYENVRPQSMGTAALKFDRDGNVAWDEIWTSFCDLALAGGPPHRGTLLEAVTAAEALAEPEQYQTVVAEIERAIRLTTALQLVTSRTPGWVGIRCESEEMAIWLMRAIIVENVMVRREGEILFVPAGPRFTVKREIKNVVTAIAKTVHHWKAHLTARRRSGEYES